MTNRANLIRLLLLLLLVWLLTGCAATLKPPLPLDQPAEVFVLDHGRHNSLVLVVAEDRVMRYAFGEWRWYVDGETGPLRSLDALLRATPSALGRMRLHGPPEPDCWVDQVGSEIRTVLVFAAERARVEALAQAIDSHFEGRDAEPYYSQLLNLEFVRHERAYSLGFNSNHQVVAWLELLDFEVRGSPMIGRLRALQPGRSVMADSSNCSAASHSDSSDA